MTREASVAAALALLLIALAFAAPGFYDPRNLGDVLLANAAVLVAAVGMTLVILARQIDVSIGAQFAVCSVAAGLLAKAGWPMPLVLCGTLACGALLGAINGWLVARANLPAIVVTLAMMAILRNGIQLATQGAWVRNLPAGFQWFGWGQARGEWAIGAVALAVFALAAWGLRFLGAGRAIYATGSDAEAARLAGIATGAVTLGVFIAMGSLTGLAATLDSTRFSEIQSNSGVGFELRVIAAVVVGGTSINGGRGSALGTLLGVAILGCIAPALTFLGVNAYWEKAIQGAIILWAVTMDAALARWGRYAAAR